MIFHQKYIYAYMYVSPNHEMLIVVKIIPNSSQLIRIVSNDNTIRPTTSTMPTIQGQTSSLEAKSSNIKVRHLHVFLFHDI